MRSSFIILPACALLLGSCKMAHPTANAEFPEVDGIQIPNRTPAKKSWFYESRAETILKRRHKIARLSRKGVPISEIAEKMKMPDYMVKQDLEVIAIQNLPTNPAP